jgi:adenosylmethionine-8-amino-7-oxononanoate aminotransferase
MEAVVHEHHASIAACIVEPLCQGAAGMRIYPAAYLQKLRRLTREYGILLIADEIAVGFGRTGELFASGLAGIEPDIMCLGKALTGGMLPLSATVVTREIHDAFRNTGSRDRTFYHGHTTCGSPITMKAALEACRIYERGRVLAEAAEAMQALHQGFDDFASLDCVYKPAQLGMMSALEIREEAGGAVRAGEVALNALKRGLFIRPLGPVLYLWPPLTTTGDQMHEMLLIMKEALS